MSSNKKNNRNNRNNKKRGNRRRRGNTSSGKPGVFKSIQNKPVMTRTIRYQRTDTSATQTISQIDLLCMLGFVYTGDDLFYRLFESVRLVRVGVTGMANSATGLATVGFEWMGQNAPSRLYEQVMNSTTPCHENYYPPENSSCGWWWNRSATTAVDLMRFSAVYVTTAPVVFVDLEIQYVLDDGDCATTTLAAASGSTGIAYGAIPVGSGTLSADFTPVGLTYAL